jgi:ribosomal protein S18 acetylase RimI-like enzyme
MVTLRQATSNDFDFLYLLHATTMRDYVDATWGWVEEWQQEYFARKFDPQSRQIIQVDNQDAGVIIVEQRSDELYIALIEIMPAFQRRGIGSMLICNNIEKAHALGLPLSLHVLKNNVPARRLYERLGFAIFREEDHRYKMICSPRAQEK